MDWWITITLYKTKNGNYFILNIPKEMKEVGYKGECYEEDSNLFEESELSKLSKEECGVYRMTLKTTIHNISYEEVLEKAKQGKWFFFTIQYYIKRF